MRILSIIVLLLVCARADAVQYWLTFESIWNEFSHPETYPGASTFISPSIAVAHTDQIRFWDEDDESSPGFTQFITSGSTSVLAQELTSAREIGRLLSVVVGEQVSSPDRVSFSLGLLEPYHYATLFAALVPTSDWFTGLTAIDMMPNGEWVEDITFGLEAYDAGRLTDFLSLENRTIRSLHHDLISPFFNTAEIAVLRMQLLPLCDVNIDGECDHGDLNIVDGLYSVGILDKTTNVTTPLVKFDMDDSVGINTLDLDRWLAEAATYNGFSSPYLKGDANLDGEVNFTDYLILSDNFGEGVEWSQGNFRGGGTTSFADFLLLSENFGIVLERTTESVPEPAAGWPLIGLLFRLVLALRSRSAR